MNQVESSEGATSKVQSSEEVTREVQSSEGVTSEVQSNQIQSSEVQSSQIQSSEGVISQVQFSEGVISQVQSREKDAGQLKSNDSSPPSKKRKRVYKFQSSWQKRRPWLIWKEEENLMYCTFCMQFDKSELPNSFRDGCSSFRIGIVESHQTSRSHKCAEACRITSCTQPKERPLEKLVSGMEKNEQSQMMVLFKTAYHLAKLGRPFSDFKKELEFLKSLDVKVSDTYGNDMQCHIFTDFIGQDLQNRMKSVFDGKFFAILADGSTDVSVTEAEIIYLRYIEQGLPVTRFFIVKYVEKANAENLTKVLENVMEKEMGQELKKQLVACCFDGANVMLGEKSGVTTRLKTELPHLTVIHCCAHRLELVIKDVFKRADSMKSVEDLLYRIYKHYKFSPLNWAEMKNAGEALGETVRKPVNNQGTRWVSHHQRAVSVMVSNYPAMVTHMSEVVTAVKGDRHERTKQLLGEIQAPQIPLILNFLSFYLAAIERLSLSFQSPDLTICQVQKRISAINSLIESSQDEAKLRKIMMDGIAITDAGEISFRGAEVKLPRAGRGRTNPQDAFEKALKEISKDGMLVLNLTQQYMEARFKDLLDNPILVYSSVFQPDTWPTGVELATYGEESVKKLFQHFTVPLSSSGFQQNNAIIQWAELKLSVCEYLHSSGKSHSEVWQHFIQCDKISNQFPDILALVEIVLLIPTNTADCERGFSLMNRVKSDWRARLECSSVTNLMRISLHHASISEYDPSNAVSLWWAAGKRRPATKPYGPRET